MSRMPDGFVEKFAPTAHCGRIFGVEIDDLDREEMIAVIGYQHQIAEQSRKSHEADLDFFMEVSR